jgi:sulfur carrier protein ThiS adenylyltransferase
MTDRYERQKDLIPMDRLSQCRATVIGVGAIGRQVALQLTAIGIANLQLIDPDVVEIVNLAPQGYLPADIGMAKVTATARACLALNDQVNISEQQERFRRSGSVGDILFCCVDSIETRRLIFSAVKDQCRLFVDGRMSAEVLRVLCVSDSPSRDYYPSTLFAGSEAFAGSCTAKSTIYCANIAAGLMLACFTRFLRGLPVERDVSLNLLAGEMAVT